MTGKPETIHMDGKRDLGCLAIAVSSTAGMQMLLEEKSPMHLLKGSVPRRISKAIVTELSREISGYRKSLIGLSNRQKIP
jgi:hypothetical protein